MFVKKPCNRHRRMMPFAKKRSVSLRPLTENNHFPGSPFGSVLDARLLRSRCRFRHSSKESRSSLYTKVFQRPGQTEEMLSQVLSDASKPLNFQFFSKQFVDDAVEAMSINRVC